MVEDTSPPKKLSPPPEHLRKITAATSLYGYANVNKVNANSSGKKKYGIILTPLMVCMLNVGERSVKRIISMTDLSKIVVSENRILFVPNNTAEGTLLVEWTSNSENDPSTMHEFVSVLKKLYVTRSPNHSQLHVENGSGDLRRDHMAASVKKAPRDAMTKIVHDVKNSPQQSPQQQAISPPASPMSGGVDPKHGMGNFGSEVGFGENYDSEKEVEGVDLRGTNLINAGEQERPYPTMDTRVAGSIPRRSAPRTATSLSLPGPIQPNPRYVPGHWASRSPPPPPHGLPGDDSPWEVHYSRSAEGRPYWYNPLTGDNTWTPPKGHSYPVDSTPSRTRPPWVPAIGVSPNLSPRSSPRNEPLGPSPFSPSLSGAADQNSAIAVIQHAAACSGTDVHELLEAAHDIVGKRALTYVSI